MHSLNGVYHDQEIVHCAKDSNMPNLWRKQRIKLLIFSLLRGSLDISCKVAGLPY